MTVRPVADLAAEIREALDVLYMRVDAAVDPSVRKAGLDALGVLERLRERAETAERALAEGLAIVEWTTANKPAAGLWRRQEDVDRVVAFLTTARDALAARVVGHEPGAVE